MRREGRQQAPQQRGMRQPQQPAAAGQREAEAAPGSSLYLAAARCAAEAATCSACRMPRNARSSRSRAAAAHASVRGAAGIACLVPSPASLLPPARLGLQYTEPLEVEDLEAKRWNKFDGTRQYARDKRRQVRSGCAPTGPSYSGRPSPGLAQPLASLAPAQGLQPSRPAPWATPMPRLRVACPPALAALAPPACGGELAPTQSSAPPGPACARRWPWPSASASGGRRRAAARAPMPCTLAGRRQKE